MDHVMLMDMAKVGAIVVIGVILAAIFFSADPPSDDDGDWYDI